MQAVRRSPLYFTARAAVRRSVPVVVEAAHGVAFGVAWLISVSGVALLFLIVAGR